MINELLTSDAPNRPITITLLFLLSLESLLSGNKLINLLSLVGRLFYDLNGAFWIEWPLLFFFLMTYALRGLPEIVFP